MIAGINASAYVLGEEALHLSRESSYIGTLIDDLVTKGTDDPYRMMTARSENRLSLRHSNADARLTPIGRKYGLISDERWKLFSEKMDNIAEIIENVKKYTVHPTEDLNTFLVESGTSALTQPLKFDQLIRRPQVTFDNISKYVDFDWNYRADELQEAYLQIVYENYIERQNAQNTHLRALERIKIPAEMNYTNIVGLSSEAIEKLSKNTPDTLLQASHISGVSPSDINIIMTWLKAGGHRGE